MSDTAEYSGTSLSIKEEVVYSDECYIKSEVKDEPDAILGEVVFKEEYKEHDLKVETKCEEISSSINTDNTVYEGFLDFSSTAACNDSVVVKCWICETDSCEHLQFSNITTTGEPVDDATQQIGQFDANQELEHHTVVSALLPHPKSQTNKCFTCSYCDYKSNHNGHLQRHIKAKHTVGEYSFRCSHSNCDYKSHYNYNLQNHIRAKHTGEYLFSCPDCDYKCIRNDQLRNHIRDKHTTGEYLFRCSHSDCDYKYKTKRHLQRHVAVKHTGERLFSCPDCDYKCIRKVDLQYHIRSNHTGEYFKYRCSHCDYKCNWKAGLQIHFRAKHTAEYLFGCSDFYS